MKIQAYELRSGDIVIIDGERQEVEATVQDLDDIDTIGVSFINGEQRTFPFDQEFEVERVI